MESTERLVATDRAGLTAVLLGEYPAAYRLAVGLCGRADVAGAVAARVLDRAAVAAGRWGSAEQASRWFIRYTVLTARLALKDADQPVLPWLAPLTSQQREAIVLHHGVGLDLHRMAAAMDCSSQAAVNHLVAATEQLRATGSVGAWTAALPGELAAVVPPPAVLAGHVAGVVRRRTRWATVVRTTKVVVGLALIATVTCAAAWAWRHVIVP